MVEERRLGGIRSFDATPCHCSNTRPIYFPFSYGFVTNALRDDIDFHQMDRNRNHSVQIASDFLYVRVKGPSWADRNDFSGTNFKEIKKKVETFDTFLSMTYLLYFVS